MRIPIFLTFGAIAPIIISTAALANTVVTSQTYVDNRDALKVNIAQGTGDNNANVGKTLVVNASGNLELGTVAATNYVEDSITDGVTNKAPSENAVHDALANKQNQIPVTGTNASTPGDTVVTYTSTAGTIGERGIATQYVAGYSDAETGDWVEPGNDDLVTGSYVKSAIQSAQSEQSVRTPVVKKTCTAWSSNQHTDANCLLWDLSIRYVYAKQCLTDSDCGGSLSYCQDGTCVEIDI